MRVPTRNLFQLIRECFYYTYKFFPTIEKPARTCRGRFSAVFPAPHHELHRSNINYQFSNVYANSKPIHAYQGEFLLHLQIFPDDRKAC